MLFPNITCLDSRSNVRDETEKVNGSLYSQALAPWKSIESLADYTSHLNMATHLFNYTQCDKLTKLQMYFDDYETTEDLSESLHRDLLQDLINNIHNAPSLEYISFSKTAIRLVDMENLHNSLPKLKSVVLGRVAIYAGDKISNIADIL